TEVVDKTSNEIDKVEDISSSIWVQASKSSQSTVSYKKKEKLGCLNQGIQEAEVYAEASNNKEPKSAEESNFNRKKGKERSVMSNRPQGNYIHKFVDQKYKPKKKSNNMHYEGKENQNRNIMVTNELQIALTGAPVVIKKASAPLAVVDLEYRLAVAPSEVLLDTKDHFKGQFRERCPKIECMTENWKAIYSPVNEAQEN
ncbi:3222_t:CDS:2, partial [Gigaspora margarita]